MWTDREAKILRYLETVEHGAWYSARQIADHSGVFAEFSNRSKAGAMTAELKRLHNFGYVEKETSGKPTLWRRSANGSESR